MAARLSLLWQVTPTGDLVATYTNSGATFTIGYTEPTLLQNGQPLTNLTGTNLYWKLDAGTETKILISASKPQGGGAITRDITVPVAPGQKATLNVAATGVNSYGESVRAAAARIVDRLAEVAPEAPTALTIS